MTMRSRGVLKPWSLTIIKSKDRILNNLTLWVLYIMRELNQMVTTIDYEIRCRIRFDKRKSPVGRYWSSVDISIFGIIIIIILQPYITSFF